MSGRKRDSPRRDGLPETLGLRNSVQGTHLPLDAGQALLLVAHEVHVVELGHVHALVTRSVGANERNFSKSIWAVHGLELGHFGIRKKRGEFLATVIGRHVRRACERAHYHSWLVCFCFFHTRNAAQRRPARSVPEETHKRAQKGEGFSISMHHG